MISIITPSLDGGMPEVGSVPQPYEIIGATVKGIGRARNSGARLANGDLFIFADSDIAILDTFWALVAEIRRGEFAMSRSHDGIPSGRLVAIHRADFDRVRFDERYECAAEDSDFYFRCLNAGLTFMEFPSSLLEHRDHPERARDRAVARQICRDQARLVYTHFEKRPRETLRYSTFGWQLRHFKLRSLAYELLDIAGGLA
jgi:glycosyltransferase involved in cell wall biosynthesis